jgi:hypothetical protein
VRPVHVVREVKKREKGSGAARQTVRRALCVDDGTTMRNLCERGGCVEGGEGVGAAKQTVRQRLAGMMARPRATCENDEQTCDNQTVSVSK